MPEDSKNVLVLIKAEELMGGVLFVVGGNSKK
jgi:hypothetical protein